ncbi:hypothetical protein [Pseudooceanicola spongiae]|uniref:Uncharacterized protein n=1 Tax=Pseudooceanicola spongiae TaxID=2613965 RepID=A0A7L9WN63_9RHOB|nr:hypothetical protein [Pseudooceanicola spongiae]QOL80510.1 hypothetical protein F3W81_06615 [Pseudooceanicola spongiae]
MRRPVRWRIGGLGTGLGVQRQGAVILDDLGLRDTRPGFDHQHVEARVEAVSRDGDADHSGADLRGTGHGVAF